MKDITDVRVEISQENNPLYYINNFDKIEVLLVSFPSLTMSEFREEDDVLVDLFTSRIYSAGAYLLFFPDYYKATDILNCIWQTDANYQSSQESNPFFNGRILFINGRPVAFTEFIPVDTTYSNVLLFPEEIIHPELSDINTILTVDDVKNRLLTFSRN